MAYIRLECSKEYRFDVILAFIDSEKSLDSIANEKGYEVWQGEILSPVHF